MFRLVQSLAQRLMDVTQVNSLPTAGYRRCSVKMHRGQHQIRLDLNRRIEQRLTGRDATDNSQHLWSAFNLQAVGAVIADCSAIKVTICFFYQRGQSDAAAIYRDLLGTSSEVSESHKNCVQGRGG